MVRGHRIQKQIIGILNEAAAGAAAVEVCRRHGISETTFYRWKAKFGGLAVSDTKRLRRLEAENGRLKRLLAEAHLDNAALKDLPEKKLVTPAARRRAHRPQPSDSIILSKMNILQAII